MYPPASTPSAVVDLDRDLAGLDEDELLSIVATQWRPELACKVLAKK